MISVQNQECGKNKWKSRVKMVQNLERILSQRKQFQYLSLKDSENRIYHLDPTKMAAKYYKSSFTTIFLDFHVLLNISRKISPNFKQFYAYGYYFSGSGRKE